MKWKNNVGKKWAHPGDRQVISKPAWGWGQKTNLPHLWKIWKISIFVMAEKKRCLLCVTVWARGAIWLCSSHNGDTSVIVCGVQVCPGQCLSFLLECRAVHNHHNECLTVVEGVESSQEQDCVLLFRENLTTCYICWLGTRGRLLKFKCITIWI